MCDPNDKNKSTKRSSLVEVLREESLTWTEKQWGSYLTTLEVPLRETLTKEYDDLAGNLEATDPDAPRLTEAAMQRLQAAIDQLSPRQKAVIEAKFWGGMSEHEIAKREGVSRTTVQTYMARAIARLKWLLSSKFPLSEGTKNHSPHDSRPNRTKDGKVSQGVADE